MPDLNSFLPLQSSKFFINLSTYLSIILSIYSYLLLLPGNRLVTGSPVVCCLSLCLTGEQLRKVLSADKKTFYQRCGLKREQRIHNVWVTTCSHLKFFPFL